MLRTHICMYLLLFVGTVPALQAQKENGHRQKRTAESYQKEIDRLRSRAESLELEATSEPDGRKRDLMERTVAKAREVADLREKEMNIQRQQKREVAMMEANEARKQLKMLRQELEDLNEQERVAKNAPAPTPVPVPDTVETESGFRVRLNITD